MRHEAIGPVLGARAARARRACERWAEDNDARGAPLEALQDAAVALAEERGKDLDEAAVAKVCREVVASWVDCREQRASAAALSDAREQQREAERLEYLRRRQADYKLGLGGGGVVPPHGQRGPR